jgi:hypothetical protein
MRARIMISFCLLLGGCATRTEREAAAEARGYERGLRDAMQERYWRIQEQQRAAHPAVP